MNVAQRGIEVALPSSHVVIVLDLVAWFATSFRAAGDHVEQVHEGIVEGVTRHTSPLAERIVCPRVAVDVEELIGPLAQRVFSRRAPDRVPRFSFCDIEREERATAPLQLSPR